MNNDWNTIVTTFLTHLGFHDFRVEVDEEHKSGAIFIYDTFHVGSKENIPEFIEQVNHLMQLIAKQKKLTPIFFDINNYRRQREQLIGELARTAARKVASTKTDVTLPAMNSYERRIVHMELAAHPTVRTESAGNGKERRVIIKPVAE